MSLTSVDRDTLLWIARESMTLHLTGCGPLVLPREGVLGEPRAAFVTLRRLGRLRGCVGHAEPTCALADVVARCAIAAAVRDPRFPPLAPADLVAVSIEISVLSAFEPIRDPEEVEIGRHGLVVERGRHRGLLLPKVPVEWNWDPFTFVRQACIKAGLPADAWERGAHLWRFDADVFGEPDAQGLA